MTPIDKASIMDIASTTLEFLMILNRTFLEINQTIEPAKIIKKKTNKSEIVGQICSIFFKDKCL